MCEQPVGEVLDDSTARELLDNNGLQGRFVELHKVDPELQLDDLYDASHGDRQKETVWTYMPMSGPFARPADMRSWLQLCRDHPEYFLCRI